MTQLATFIVHYGKHIQRRKRELYSTHERQAFVYVNIAHMEVDDIVVSQKHCLC